jgi:hypothetical protein
MEEWTKETPGHVSLDADVLGVFLWNLQGTWELY